MDQVIRFVERSDLDGLLRLAKQTTFGLTTLTPDRERLADRIEASIAGIAPLFVLTREQPGEMLCEIIGTSGLFTQVGDASRNEPFYAYRLERTVHQSESLDVHREVDTLHLAKIYSGPTELSTLFLHPDHRGGGNGRVMSLSRFLWMFREPDRTDVRVIAELRGVVSEQGHSAFWESIGRHFFQVEFPVADLLSVRDKRFIAELMPTHPIYVPLLPDDAQAVIGKVHPKTARAKRFLESEGFYFADMVDIFDGGPCLRCDRAAIRTIREATRCPLVALSDRLDDQTSERLDTLVSTARGPYRAIGSYSERRDDGIVLSSRDADRLQVSVGDPLCVTPLSGRASEFWHSGPPSIA